MYILVYWWNYFRNVSDKSFKTQNLSLKRLEQLISFLNECSFSFGMSFMIRCQARSRSLSDTILTSGTWAYIQPKIIFDHCYNCWFSCCNPESSTVYKVLPSYRYCACLLKFTDILPVHKSCPCIKPYHVGTHFNALEERNLMVLFS